MKRVVLLCAALLTLPLALMAGDDGSRLGSVGLQVVPTVTGELVVLQIPPGTPAAASGMKPGDLIVQIDGFPLVGSDFAKVVAQHLWGAEGSQVVVHFLRPGEAGRKSVTLRRAAADPQLTVSPTVLNGTPNKGGKK